MSNDDQFPEDFFSDADSLTLHQLRLLEWLDNSERSKPKSDDSQNPEILAPRTVPGKWNLTQGITPYDWQNNCIENWFENNCRGTVKVVTGGGKTLLALAIAEQLQNRRQPDLYVAIVVPTIVLMHQWRDELVERGNVPVEAIGRLGGGHDDKIGGDCRILITVLASASSRLAKQVDAAGVGDRLMLIVDECHRSGSKDMSNVFATERAYSLGLSATPEREDDVDAGYDESTVGQEVGKIIYEYNLIDALADGLVPKFTINHFGLSLNKKERAKYEDLSRSITDAMSKLKPIHASSRSKGDFFSWARSIATRGGESSGTAMRFISDSSRRRELLNRMEARHQAVETLLSREFKINPDARVILFHESIDEVMDLFCRLRQLGLPAIAEHSELPNSIRESGLDLFRRGLAKIIVSARSLIEGFNVPAVDVGIIVASSGSVRQRIQSLGRVLRRHKGLKGEEKTSCIYVLYAAETSEDFLYGKHDWDATTGVEQNRYYLWDLNAEPAEQDGPPRTPLPTEVQVPRDTLEEGGIYPGRYEGIELSCDSQNNITNEGGQFLTNGGDLVSQVATLKGSAGRFMVTPKNQYVLIRIPGTEDWETRFVTQLDAPLEFSDADTAATLPLAEVDAWLESSTVGAEYPFGDLEPTTSLKYKRKSGGVIARKVKDGEVYARNSSKAEDNAKGKDAETTVAALQQLYQQGNQVHKIEINRLNHVLFRESGKLFFVCALEKGLEFPR